MQLPELHCSRVAGLPLVPAPPANSPSSGAPTYPSPTTTRGFLLLERLFLTHWWLRPPGHRSQEPSNAHSVLSQPLEPALWLAGTQAESRHPTCLTCLTSSSLHPPEPQVSSHPALPVPSFRPLSFLTAPPPAGAKPSRALPSSILWLQ